MSWLARRAHLGLGLRQGQFQPGPLRGALPLLAGQLRPGRGLPPGVVLLGLDRFALPTAGHTHSIDYGAYSAYGAFSAKGLVRDVFFAAVTVAQVATALVVATCSVPTDPQQREWRLVRWDAPGTATPGRSPQSGARSPEWSVQFRGRMLDKPAIDLRLPGAAPVLTPGEVRLSYATANGGRSIEWRAVNGASTLDLHVSHGLEVNVEADLDPAVDHMNTDGPVAVSCELRSGEAVRPARAVAAAAPVGMCPQPGRPGARTEWMLLAGAAQSVALFQSSGDRTYGVQTVSWGRALTRPRGPGLLRGCFTWAVEATPLLIQFTPSRLYGAGVAPVVWRWNLLPTESWSVFAELSMGGLWTSEPIPDKTNRVNFTAHWGGGVRWHRSVRDSAVLAYRFQHFSNGNQLGSNPGVNSHVVLAGWSRRSAR